MKILFWICWVVNLLVLLVLSYESFFARSSAKYGLINLLLLVLGAGSWWLRNREPKWAMALAGLPAALLLLFMLSNVIALTGNKR
jgi:hypothetical protein